jgi:hypothetical protein
VARVEYEAVYASDIDFVLTTLLDEMFLAEYAKEIGALDWDIAVDREDVVSRTRLRLTVPTHGVPPLFKRFVSPTIEIIELREWSTAAPQGVRNGRLAVDATVSKRDARVRGVVALKSVPEGTRFSAVADISVNLPLVGDRAAGLIKDLIVRVLGQQTKVMGRWLQ